MNNRITQSNSRSTYIRAQLMHWLLLAVLQPLLIFAIYRATNVGKHMITACVMGIAYVIQFVALKEHWCDQRDASYFVIPIFGAPLLFWVSVANSLPISLSGLLVITFFYCSYRCHKKIEDHAVRPTRRRAIQSEENLKVTSIQYFAEITNNKLSEIIGMSETKERLISAVTEIVTKSENSSVRNGILFTGDPGNGKTAFANALAGEFSLPIISVAVGDLASQWINKTTENVKKVFSDARAQAPCILFLDEVDSLLGDRKGDQSSNTESRNIVNTILTESIKIRRSGVVLIAATNFVDKLDPAAIREGRFDFKIEIPCPDQNARIALIMTSFGNKKIAISAEVVQSAAKRWEGYSSKRLLAICEETIKNRKTTNRVELKDLMDSLRRLQGRKGRVPENTKSLDELILSNDIRIRVQGLISRMVNISEIETLGGTVPKGLIMAGPPGTGKSSLAATLAKETEWAFLPTIGADLMRPDAIDKLMTEAKELRPAIIFIDEADDLFKDRRMSQFASYTNKMLTAMDGAMGAMPDVLFMAATNHLDNFDSAALRPGRFTEKLHFSFPDEDMRAYYVGRWIQASKARFDSNYSAAEFTHLIGECSIPELQAVLQEAVNHMLTAATRTGLGIRPVTVVDVRVARRAVLS